jgi:hypothetical protein
MSNRFVYLKVFLSLILVCCWQACAESGQSPDRAQTGSADDLPAADEQKPTEPKAPIVLQPNPLLAWNSQSESCRNQTDLAQIDRPDTVLTVDGALADWPDDAFAAQTEDGLNVRLLANDVGIYFSLSTTEGTALPTVMTFDLARLRLDDQARLELVEEVKIRWQDGRLWLRGAGRWEPFDDPRLARGVRRNEMIELFVSQWFDEGILDGMIWSLGLAHGADAASEQQQGFWLFRGRDPLWQGALRYQHCAFPTIDAGLATTEFWDMSPEAGLARDRLDAHLAAVRLGLQAALSRLAPLRTSPMTVPVLLVPEERRDAYQMQDQFPAILWLNRQRFAHDDLAIHTSLNLYQDSALFLIRRILRESPVAADQDWRKVVAYALFDQLITATQGRYAQLLALRRHQNQWDSADPEQNRRVLGYFLGRRFSSDTLIASWLSCRDAAVRFSACFKQELFAEPEPAALAGWLDQQGDFHPEWKPELAEDSDGDGLPDEMEVAVNLQVDRFDSDQDGWSDLAEILTGKDGRSAISHPSALVYDGWFAEWLDLLPNRVKADPEESTLACPKVDLLYFSGFQAAQWLMIGAQLREIPDSSALIWELSLDDPDSSQSFLIRQQVGLRTTQISLADAGNQAQMVHPFQSVSSDFEIYLSTTVLQRLLKVATQAAELPPIAKFHGKITIYQLDGEQPKFCDDTPWFDLIPAQGLKPGS